MKHSTRTRIIAGGLSLVLAGACAVTDMGAGTAQATPLYDNTSLGSFFKVSQRRLNSLPNGALIRQRTVPNISVPGAEVVQYLFKSTNSHGKAIAASAAATRPRVAKPNANILVYNDFINSLGVKCQPSFGFESSFNVATGKSPASSYDGEIAYRNSVVMELANVGTLWGMVMIFPDFLGLESAYSANILGAHITLDSIRAARHLQGFSLKNSKTILSGYSGGSMVSAYAAAMSPRYAPDLHFEGMAIGGMPVDMAQMGLRLGNRPHAGFGIMLGTLLGMEREYPHRMNIYNRMNAKGKRIARANRNACTPRLLDAGKNESVSSLFTNVTLRKQKRELAVFSENSIVNYAPSPRVPLFVWGSTTDVLVPQQMVDRLTARWCRANNQKLRVYTVDTKIPNHVTNAMAGFWIAFPWIAKRFAGVPAPNNTCH